ncbi:transcription factor of the MADS box [Coemansia sp. RSA 1939]|nr:transcription factor of the MADS box [Coemansia sp. RSA 1939]
MYGYEPKVLAYSDNLSICSTETAAPTPSSLDLSSVATVASSSLPANPASAVPAPHHLFKMNSAFMPDDPSRLASGYASVDPTAGAGGILFDHHANGNHSLAANPHSGQQQDHHQTEQQAVVDHISAQQHQSEQQHPQMVRFSPSLETRTQTPAAKRSREDDESEAGESESNSRGATEPNPVEKRSGRRKIKIEYIEDKSRRHITFSKRKAGIMKKAYELSTLTGTQVLLLVVSETGLVYTFTTPKLQPIVTQPEGKNLIQACLSVPDQPGERVSQPIPTESNAYMSQPRHSHSVGSTGVYATPAMAAAVAAASNVASNGNGSFASAASDDRKQQLGSSDESPGAAGVNHAAAPYLQYPYGQSAVAQAVAAAANGGMQYATLPGYASYPNSNSQSQHHSPIAAATPHASQQQQQQQQQHQQQQGADATSIPGMNSLTSYHHHGYSNHAQQQQQQSMKQNHYAYHPLQTQGHYQQHQHQSPHSAMPGSEGHSVSNSSSVTAAMAAAVVAATAGGSGHHSAQQQHHQQQQQHQGNASSMSAVPYMTANHYWQPAAGIASPHLSQQQGQHQQTQQTAAGLIQRTGYGTGGN